MKRTISLMLSLLTLIMILFSNVYFAQAETETVYAQYSGEANTTWGMNPNCTFTIEKIENGDSEAEFLRLI